MENQTLAWCDDQAAARQPAKNQSLFLRFQYVEVEEKLACGKGNCILQFDRLQCAYGTYGHFVPSEYKIENDGQFNLSQDKADRCRHLTDPWLDKVSTSLPEGMIIDAINGSKVFLSGSVLVSEHVKNCKTWSWRVVTQAEESSNNLYYGPSDVSSFCSPDTPGGRDGTVLIILPVHAIWARAYGVSPDVNDPSWKSNSAPPSGHDCSNGPPYGIRPCDAKQNLALRVLYWKPARWMYNRQAQPGVSQGSLSIAPIAPNTKATFDVQTYESSLLGPGWFGNQIMYEHDRNAADDLNSLTGAFTYDLRLANPSKPSPWLLGAAWGGHTASASDCFDSGGNSNDKCAPPIVGIRPFELLMRVGGEWSPDSFTSGHTEYLRRDANVVMGSTLRFPIIFSSASQPSQFTVTPVLGLEGGFRITSHDIGKGVSCLATSQNATCAPQPEQIFRQVAGVDASASWRYNFTHNFFGDRPFTVDFSYRIRRLSYAEPWANEMYVIHNVNTPFAGQSTGGRAYSRLTFLAPISAYVQGRITWQHGSLPPLFQYVGNEVTLGLTFSNPGLSEH